MSYFSRRNKHIVEFSGHEEVSRPLRERLSAILNQYVGENPTSYNGGDPWYVERGDFRYEVQKEFPGKDPFGLINSGEFHEVFTVVEVFLDMATGIYYSRRNEALLEILQAFSLSGSVYTINNRRIELKIDKDLAEKLESIKPILSTHQSAYEKFFDGIGNLFGRKAKAEDIVKDVFVAFEDYLKTQTGAKEYGGALSHLEKTGVISSTQRALLEKVYAYRSDTYGVGHAGNSQKPQEVDALWFVETVTAQILFIDRKLKHATT